MKNTSTRKAINLTLSLLMMLAMTAFLFAQIAKTEAYATGEDTSLPVAGEVISQEEQFEEEPIKSNALEDSDTLLEKYIEETAPALAEEAMMGAASSDEEEQPIASARYWRLGEAEKIAYMEILKMVRSVAEGETNQAEITIPLIDIYSEDYLKEEYSASDLGLDSLIEDGDISDDAMSALYKEYSLDVRSIMIALLRDYPERFFWFDSTEGIDPKISFNAKGRDTDDGDVVIWVDLESEPSYWLGFTVAADYKPQESEREYRTNSEKIKSVSDAISNAMGIVNDASGETDYNKLVDYKDNICELVTYDEYASDDDNNVPYGDPWQLIYVFDKNPETNVVCEGYSKAFKFLCDFTVFSDESTSCNLVTGDMMVGGTAGPHMWNVVSIGGENYLTDVTNCDEEMIGYTDKLFLRGNPKPIPVCVTLDGAEYDSEQYAFNISGTKVSYVYDADTVIMFDESERILDVYDYGIIPIDIPTGKTLTYNGKAQTGVAAGTGYTLSGTSKATKAGSYTVKATPKSGYCWKDGSTDAKTIKWTINKAANPLTVKAKTKTIKYKTLKKKKQTLGIKNVVTFTKNGQGTVTYVKASGNKGITINKKTGAVTVKKGLKKGTYRVKVKISAAGNVNYKKSAAKTVTFTVKVK